MSDEVEALSLPEAAFTSIIILLVGTGALVSTADFTKKENVNLTAQKIYNNALALQSFPEGYTEVDASGYGIKYEAGKLHVKMEEKVARKSLQDLGFNRIEAPAEFRNVEEKLCIRKKTSSSGSILALSPEGC